jgi:hypothetical protein
MSADAAVSAVAWSSLCRSPQTVYTLNPQDWAQVMNRGAQWQGQAAGYNPTSATMILRTCTAKTILSTDMNYYRLIFLYAFALCFEMEWDATFPVLNAEQTDAAFLLQEYINDHPDNNLGDVEEELPWDKQKLPLSQVLQLAYKRAEAPMTHEVRKELLKKLPLVEGIPEFAKENNFKTDATREADKIHKAWEKSLDEGLRVLACLDAKLNNEDEELVEGTKKELMTTAFFLFAELQHRIQDYRRTTSVPGSVTKDKDNLLFTKEEVATAKLQRSVDSMRSKGGYNSKGGKGQQNRFRNSPNPYVAQSSSDYGGYQSGPQKGGKGGRKGGGGRGGKGRKG